MKWELHSRQASASVIYKAEVRKEKTPADSRLRKFHSTQLGEIYLGDSLKLIREKIDDDSVDLIMTSPPFGLVRKKDYGNVDAHNYVEWFKPFGRAFRLVLKPSGSLVIDIGGAWIPVRRTRCAARLQRQANWGVLTNAM